MRRLSLAVNPCKVCQEYNCEREGYGDECTNCCFFYASQFKAREDLNLELVKNENKIEMKKTSERRIHFF